MIALDTNVVIDLLRQEAPVRRRFDTARRSETAMAISVLAFEELLFGVARSPRAVQQQATLAALLAGIDVLPFERSDAEVASRARAQMASVGRPPPQIDLLIGAHAIARGLTLVTANTRDFEHIPGIKLLDWRQPPDNLQD